MSILNNEKEKNIIQMTEENKIAENKNNNIPKKKHVSFTKPCYEIIDVESYKKLNEDISETRFYYVADKKDNRDDHAKANCSCSVF